MSDDKKNPISEQEKWNQSTGDKTIDIVTMEIVVVDDQPCPKCGSY